MNGTFHVKRNNPSKETVNAELKTSESCATGKESKNAQIGKHTLMGYLISKYTQISTKSA